MLYIQINFFLYFVLKILIQWTLLIVCSAVPRFIFIFVILWNLNTFFALIWLFLCVRKFKKSTGDYWGFFLYGKVLCSLCIFVSFKCFLEFWLAWRKNLVNRDFYAILFWIHLIFRWTVFIWLFENFIQILLPWNSKSLQSLWVNECWIIDYHWWKWRF